MNIREKCDNLLKRENEWDHNIKAELMLIPLEEVNHILYRHQNGTKFGRFEGKVGKVNKNRFYRINGLQGCLSPSFWHG